MATEPKVLLKEFRDGYKDSLGDEGADNLLKDVLEKAGIPYQEAFSKEEALRICTELKLYKGFIGIVGGILMSRMILR